jgi:hypothetical protein
MRYCEEVNVPQFIYDVSVLWGFISIKGSNVRKGATELNFNGILDSGV